MNTYIKTIISLIILTLAVAGIEAQTVNPVVVIQKIVYKKMKGNIIAYSYNDTDHNGYIKMVDATTGNPIGNTKVFLKGNYTGSGVVSMGYMDLVDQNNILTAGVIDSDNTSSWNALRRYESGTNSVAEKITYGIGLKPFVVNGLYYVFTKLLPYYDFMSSGWDNAITYSGSGGEEWFITKLDNNLDIQWVYTVPIGTEPLDMTATSDNNLFVTTNNGYKKINAADGSLMVDTPVSYGVHDGLISYDEIRDNAIYIDNANHENYGKEIDGAGTEIIHTGFDPFTNYGLSISDIKTDASNDYLLANNGIGQLIKLNKSESVEKQYLIMDRSFGSNPIPAYFSVIGHLKITSDGFISIAKNTSSTPKDFFGTSIPGMNYIIYKVTVDTNPGVFMSLNDISGTHNVTQVIENSVLLPDGTFESSDIKVGYCIMNDSSNIPAVGADVSSWGLFHMNGGLQFLATHPVKENDNGRYIDGISYIPDGHSSSVYHNYFNYRVYFVHIADNTPPVAITQPYTAQLDANGQAGLSFANIDNGSYDNFGTYTVVAFSPTTVNCADVGNFTVSYTLEDATGNQTSGTETIVVNDNTAPNAPANLSIGTITETSVVVSSNDASDNCSIDHYEFYIDTNIDGLANGTLVNDTATTPNYTYTGLTSGTTYEFYNKAVDASGNTSDASNIEQTTTVGINDEKIAGLRMYPNPTTNTLNIEIDGALNHIEIYNLQGQIIRKFDTQAMSKYQINVSRLTKGVYPIHIWDKNGMQVVRKLVVK